jgi:hypothetical protein
MLHRFLLLITLVAVGWSADRPAVVLDATNRPNMLVTGDRLTVPDASGDRITIEPGVQTAPRVLSFPVLTGAATFAVLSEVQTFSAAQTVQAANGLTTLAAATQDAMRLAGRAGGSSSYIGILTPTTLTASRTWTFPNTTTTIAGLAVAQTFSEINTFSNLNITLDGAAGVPATSNVEVLFTRTGYTQARNCFRFRNSANTDSGVIGQQGTVADASILWATANTTLIYAPTQFRVAANTTATSYFEVAASAATFASGLTLNVANTTSASSAIAGAFTVGNGTAATNVAIGGGILYAGGTINSGSNIDANNFIICGVRSAFSGGGGNIRYRDDTATPRWLSGILGGAGAVDYVIYDQVGAAIRLTLTPAGLLALTATTGSHTIASTTDSTTKDNGSVILEGGIGIEKALSVGTNILLGGASLSNISNYNVSSPGTVNGINFYATGDLYLGAKSGTQVRLYAGTTAVLSLAVASTTVAAGVVTTFNDTTDSTTKDNGSVILEGGIGIEKALVAGTSIKATTTITGLTGGTVGSSTGGNIFLNLTGSAATVRGLTFQTGGSNRWLFYENSTAESGANAGSDFTLAAYDDAGAFLANAIVVTRSNFGISIPGVFSAGNTTDSTTTTTGGVIGSGGAGFAKQVSARNYLATGGTITTSQPVFDSTQTWNAGGVTFTAAKVNITDTASAAGSLLLDLQAGGTTRAYIRKDGRAGHVLVTATTAAADDVLYLGNNSSGTPAAGYGVNVWTTLKSSTTADQGAAQMTTTWVVATHASRTARQVYSIYDTAAREAFRIEASGTAPMIGFLGAAAVAQQAATVDHTDILINYGLVASGGGKIKTWRKVITATNVNSAATDVGTFTGLPTKYRVVRLQAFDASASLTTATVDLRTAAAGGGTALVSAAGMTACTAAAKFSDLTLAATATTDYQTTTTLTVRNVTAQGSAATVSFMLEVIDLN